MDLAIGLWWDRLRVLDYTPLSSVILMLFQTFVESPTSVQLDDYLISDLVSNSRHP